MNRKDFLKLSCSFCVAVGAGLSMSELLTSCAQLPVYKTEITDNQISVPLSLFADKDLQIIRPKDFDYDIGLRKEQDGSYTALLLRCTHADNQLMPTGTGYLCNLHGSEFDKEGHVTKGPAERSLKQYRTEIASGNIIIHLR